MPSITDTPTSSATDYLDPTIAPLPALVDVSETSFEGRFEDWADDARYFEYSKAANPLAGGTITAIPAIQFGPELYTEGPTGIVPLDLSDALRIEGGQPPAPVWSRTSYGSAQANVWTRRRTPPLSSIT